MGVREELPVELLLRIARIVGKTSFTWFVYAVLNYAISDRESIVDSFFSFWTLAVFVILSLLYLVELGNSAYNSGFGGYVRAWTSLRLLWPGNWSKMVKFMHLLQHDIETARREFRKLVRENKSFAIYEREYNKSLVQIMWDTKKELDRFYGIDCSLNIKLFRDEKGDGLAYFVHPEKNYLKTFLRVKSHREVKLEKDKRHEFTEREGGEKFKILLGEAWQPEELALNFQKNDRIDMPRVNSGYNYVFQGNDHFFLDNDLPAAERTKRYYSTSNNYMRFYQSVAIFLISGHQKSGVRATDTIYGLLVIDSFKKNVFHAPSTRLVGGYVAHRLKEVFDELF